MGQRAGFAHCHGTEILSKPGDNERRIETIVTYLEMTSDPHHFVPPPANLKLVLLKCEQPPLHFYRYLYNAVGGSLHWIDRRSLTDERLSELIHDENIDIFVLYVGGAPAGFFEIDHRRSDDVELKYFGLVPEFRGRGLGKWLLNEAIGCCWQHAPVRVIVDTCTLDSPAALPLYQKMGFTAYARDTKILSLPSDAG
jgi:GNAT superfamily N-acetyltransferase